MASWDHDENPRETRPGRGERAWRGAPDRDRPDSRRRFAGPDLGRGEPRTFANPRDEARGYRDGRDDRPAGYEQEAAPFEPGGAAARGYGQGGDTAYGQMASGSSDSGLGGYSGANVGGWGQPNLNSQWGAGGYGPLNQGLDYGHGGGRFGPPGYDSGDFGQHLPRGAAAPHHDEHHASYRTWRDAQLAAHDRDYGHWRNEQTRRYDEEYGSWRNARHSAFSKEFEGWRTGRGGQSPGTSSPTDASSASNAATGYAHGANPTLANIADGHEGRQHPDHDKAKAEARAEPDKDPSHH